MNDYQKALNTIGDALNYAYNNSGEEPSFNEVCTSMFLLRVLVSKENPQPVRVPNGSFINGTFVYDEFVCPNCGKTYDAKVGKLKHCTECGQKLYFGD